MFPGDARSILENWRCIPPFIKQDLAKAQLVESLQKSLEKGCRQLVKKAFEKSV